MPASLKQITDGFLRTYYAFNPVAASHDGYAGFDDTLPNYESDRVAAVVKEYEVLLGKLDGLAPAGFADKIDADLIRRKIQTQIFRLTSQREHRLNPALYVNMVSNGLFVLMMGTHRSEEEKTHYLAARLKAIPGFFEHARALLKKPVRLWTEIATKEIRGLGTYLKNVIHPFLTQRKLVGADSLIKQAHHAAFDFLNFLSGLISFKEDFAIGKDNYAFLVRTDHGLETEVAQIRDTGFEHIDRISRELARQAEKIDKDKSWQELVRLLKNNHPTEKNLLSDYRNKVSEIKQFLTENEIVTLPKEASLQVLETPGFLRESIPYAAYSPPTMFAADSQGLFFVTPPQGNQDVLKEHCYASFPLTAIHEGYPGHHLQFSRQRLLTSDIRKVYDVASNYEGWTLYCEEMMYRAGFYDDAMRLYQLKDRLWRAARIVVDVGMQTAGMSDKEAVAFLVENAKLSPQSARVDVNWYTQNPTVPMSYLIGMLEVDQMRAAYLATGRTLKEFHDAFLSCGAIPLKHVRKILFGNDHYPKVKQPRPGNTA